LANENEDGQLERGQETKPINGN